MEDPEAPTQEVDWERLKSILASPAGQNMPPALRKRMERDIAAHESSVASQPAAIQAPTFAPAETTSAIPTPQAVAPPPIQPPTFAPRDVAHVHGLIDDEIRYQTGVQVAKKQTQGLVNTMATVAMQLPIFAMQVGHDLTLGLAPSPYGENAKEETMDGITRGSQIPIKLVSGMATMMLEGAGLMKGLTYAAKVPRLARAMEFIPTRLKEIGLSALVNGGVDALRLDGLQRDENGEVVTSWLDPSTLIAKPLTELGIPDRLALGLGGGVVGGVVGPALMGIVKGTNIVRTKVVEQFTPETIGYIKEGFAKIGIGPGDLSDKFRVAHTFTKNFRKIALNEEAGSIMADQLSREQFIANEIAANGANPSAPKVVAEVLRSGPGDLANSGFHVKPDAAVVLPDAASLEIPTVEAMKQAIVKVGPEEFRHRVDMEMLQRSADPLAQAAATEEVARRILAQPAGTKSAHELLSEVAGTAFADTPAHQAAVRYAQEMDQLVRTIDTDPGLTKELLLDRMMRDKLFNADGTPYELAAKLPEKPRIGAVEPGGPPRKTSRRVKGGPESMEIPATRGAKPSDAVEAKATLPGPEGDVAAATLKLNTASDIELDGRLIAGIFRTNPGGVNIVTNVKHGAALIAAQEKLGVKLNVATFAQADGTTNVMIGRPVYNYPGFAEKNVFGSTTKKITEAMKGMAKSAATNIKSPKTTELFILADGEPIRGGLNTSAMIEKMNLQKPVVKGVGRGDLVLQQQGNFIRLEVLDNNALHITLPAQISKEQFSSLGKAIDTMNFSEVTVARGQVEKTFQSPISAVVQDHVSTMVKPQSISNSITPEMRAQYRTQGVFKGQATVLPDGSVGEIIKRHENGYMVREAMTNEEVFVHGDALTILPSALEGEYRGSNLFASYLSEPERLSLAKMRKAVASGWAKPITKFADFKQFATSRGYFSESLRGGKVRIGKVNEGGVEPIEFKDLKSAVAWVRKDTAPMAELGSDEISKFLGPDRRIGMIGGGGPPPRFNELMSVSWPEHEKNLLTLKGASPGLFQKFFKPTLPLLRDLDGKHGTQMYKVASNMQSQSVARANFESLWVYGVGGELPEGVIPWAKIFKDVGKGSNYELITAWREADDIGKLDIAKGMSPKELVAAERVAKWYDAIYPELGVEGPFVENYMPRYREALQSGKVGTFQEFMAGLAVEGKMTVPKGTDWVSDHIREGTLDAYNLNAFDVGMQYLRAGTKNRFMKEATDEARVMVQGIAVDNPHLALPLANMLQAMGGYEFLEQREAMKATFHAIIKKLPRTMTHEGELDLADKFVNWTTSLVYASTMGFRPALAARNAKDIFVMSYPIYHGDRFMEAVGRALTKEGKEEAMAARVISNYGGGMLTVDAETAADIAKLPKVFQDIHKASTVLYDSADEFTRTGTYFAARYKAEEALTKFAQGIKKQGTTDAVVEKLKAKLVRDSKVYLYGEQVQEHFLRLAASSPEEAAKYAGKQGADFTNFLYGRGMQARWMRSMGGRLMGQFGSWSMWYGDYLVQTLKRTVKGDNKADALGILARHALVNAAILEAGKEVLDVDMSRWASYGALFYSGGPGWQIAMGASTLQRGMGDMSSFGEDPLAQARVTSGANMIWHTLPAFVPYHSAFRDFKRMTSAYDQTDFLAATLGTKPTRDYQMRRKINILLGNPSAAQDPTAPGYVAPEGPFQSTSPMLGTMLNNAVTGQGQQPIDLRVTGGVETQGVGQPAPQPQPGSASASVSAKNRPLTPMTPQLPSTAPRTMETTPSGSKPIGGY